jgi:hypothetical protein
LECDVLQRQNTIRGRIIRPQLIRLRVHLGPLLFAVGIRPLSSLNQIIQSFDREGDLTGPKLRPSVAVLHVGVESKGGETVDMENDCDVPELDDFKEPYQGGNGMLSLKAIDASTPASLAFRCESKEGIRSRRLRYRIYRASAHTRKV